MTGSEHMRRLRQGIIAWNEWRREHPTIEPDFHLAHINSANLSGANLSDANLAFADLAFTDLSYADLRRAKLRGAVLTGSKLVGADLTYADLSGAHLGADFYGARVGHTNFGATYLKNVQGLDTIQHFDPSFLGALTLVQSEGDIPDAFLHGAGVNDTIIKYAREHIVEYYTCRISYAREDEAFARRLSTDLQKRGVQCWLSDEHMVIGNALRLYKKLILIFSKHSLASDWIDYEASEAAGLEYQGIYDVLYPVNIDATMSTTNTALVEHMQKYRHIGDFVHWKEHDTYQRSLNHLLRELRLKW